MASTLYIRGRTPHPATRAHLLNGAVADLTSREWWRVHISDRAGAVGFPHLFTEEQKDAIMNGGELPTMMPPEHHFGMMMGSSWTSPYHPWVRLGPAVPGGSHELIHLAESWAAEMAKPLIVVQLNSRVNWTENRPMVREFLNRAVADGLLAEDETTGKLFRTNWEGSRATARTYMARSGVSWFVGQKVKTLRTSMLAQPLGCFDTVFRRLSLI